MTKRKVYSLILFLIGLPALAVGVAVSIQSVTGQISDTRTEGHVVALELSRLGTGEITTIPIIEFTPPDSETIRFSAKAETVQSLAVGDTVSVHYDPSRPSEATLDDFWNHWLLPILGLGFGLFFTLGGWAVSTGKVDIPD